MNIIWFDMLVSIQYNYIVLLNYLITSYTNSLHSEH